jgi:hypothetical protein
MRFPIRPGKVACAGFVGILLVLPNSIWKGPDAKDQPVAKPKIERASDSSASGVKFRKVAR